MQAIEDNYIHKGKRRQLAAQLRDLGIKDAAVLAAIQTVPRHLFLDSTFMEHAYQNKAFPIGADQTISHPFTVAFQTELLQVRPGDKILEIGTGSGYQCAILISLGTQVYSIERQNLLFKKTKKLLAYLGYRAKRLTFGDGYLGMPDYAPFDSIIVTCGAAQLPQDLLRQLKVGGRLVIPIGSDPQEMHLYRREAPDDYSCTTYGSFRFVPFLKGKS